MDREPARSPDGRATHVIAEAHAPVADRGCDDKRRARRVADQRQGRRVSWVGRIDWDCARMGHGDINTMNREAAPGVDHPEADVVAEPCARSGRRGRRYHGGHFVCRSGENQTGAHAPVAHGGPGCGGPDLDAAPPGRRRSSGVRTCRHSPRRCHVFRCCWRDRRSRRSERPSPRCWTASGRSWPGRLAGRSSTAASPCRVGR